MEVEVYGKGIIMWILGQGKNTKVNSLINLKNEINHLKYYTNSINRQKRKGL